LENKNSNATNLVAFCLYGKDKKYQQGALENAKLIKKYLPGWTPIFFVSDDLPQKLSDALQVTGATLLTAESNWPRHKMLWRLLALWVEPCTRVILRDTDSRITLREVAAVEEWIASDYPIHIMRDHPCHGTPILGGMWGAKPLFVRRFLNQDILLHWSEKDGTDQDLLRKYVYPKVKSHAIIHDSYFFFEPFAKRRFSVPRESPGSFVAETFDANNVPQHEHRLLLVALECNPIHKLRWVVLTHLSYLKMTLVETIKEKYPSLNVKRRFLSK
jgi:hypothetical protein